MAFDNAGNLFVADQIEGAPQFIGAIYKFAPDGTRSTFATGNRPWALAFDSAGNLYESEFDFGTINKIRS